jgi:hypothetical protein
LNYGFDLMHSETLHSIVPEYCTLGTAAQAPLGGFIDVEHPPAVEWYCGHSEIHPMNATQNFSSREDSVLNCIGILRKESLDLAESGETCLEIKSKNSNASCLTGSSFWANRR